MDNTPRERIEHREPTMNVPATEWKRRLGRHSPGKVTTPDCRNGFSLIEILVTMAILLALVGLLIPALGFVKQRARVIEAKKDVTQIEAALNEYYATYRRWPPFIGDPTGDSPPIRIAGEMAELLIDGVYDASNNPRRITFMNFKRLNESDSPITPWGNEDLTDTTEDNDYYYWVIMDTDFNNVIEGCECIPSILTPLSNDVRRSVVAWTVNPNAESGEEAYIIGSWKQ